MGITKIQWTGTPNADGTIIPGYTFNPWIGCSKVSAGCKYCYAEKLMTRKGKWKNTWGPEGVRIQTSETYWKKPRTWNRKAEREGVRYKVFCGSLCDVFEEKHGVYSKLVKWRSDLWALINDTPYLDWLLLTKRPHNIRPMVPTTWLYDRWPDNVWVGTSAENQDTFDKRVPFLTKVPASVRFLSVEPMLGPINMRTDEWLYPMMLQGHLLFDWVIVGGESGSKARAMELDWARSIRNECRSTKISFFMKQLGGYPDKRGKMEDFPEDLRIREFPLEVVDDDIAHYDWLHNQPTL